MAIVASFSEAWIEILQASFKQELKLVASFSEAWIEMRSIISPVSSSTSPPSRRRGLKFKPSREAFYKGYCRLLLGGVD